jgi:hypothetical protein
VITVTEHIVPEIVLGTPVPLTDGPGWIIVSKRGGREEHITVIAEPTPILRAVNEIQKKNWEGAQLIARPAMIKVT